MTGEIPHLLLTVAYWLHMAATVVWIGGLATLTLIVLPAARKSLPEDTFYIFWIEAQKRLQGAGWFCLALLIVTGMFQMSSHPAYDGFLTIQNTWAAAIFAKHVAIGGMILLSAYLTWGVNPALHRIVILKKAGGEVNQEQLRNLRAREVLLLRLNGFLSLVVLAFTAWARVS